MSIEGWTLLRRTPRTTIHDLVAEARSRLTRFTVSELATLMEDDPQLVVLDTRTPTDRQRTGVIPGSLHMPRTTIEWQCDPASGYADPAITSFDQRLVVVCGEGYSSSLAAASLARLGFRNATDLIGGVAAWAREGRALEPPTHTHFG